MRLQVGPFESVVQVVAPPDEAHWHGAVPNTDCTMLAITWGTTCWHDEAPH